VDPVTGAQVYDPIKTQRAKAIFEPVIKTPLRAVLLNSPEHAPEIATYFRGIGGVFCAMAVQRQFAPEFLVDAVNSLATPKLKDPYVFIVKDAIIAGYKLLYADRGRVTLDEASWMLHVSDFACTTIDTALRDAGQQGVTTAKLKAKDDALKRHALQKVLDGYAGSRYEKLLSSHIHPVDRSAAVSAGRAGTDPGTAIADRQGWCLASGNRRGDTADRWRRSLVSAKDTHSAVAVHYTVHRHRPWVGAQLGNRSELRVV
jgi:hypothetical protein